VNASDHPLPPPPRVSGAIPVVRRADLRRLGACLAGKAREAGFLPDVVVYVERGARLLAWEICREFGCGAVPVTARRTGSGLKRGLAPLVGRLPERLRGGLRRLEERYLWKPGRGCPRAVVSSFTRSLSGRRVLVVDDAADSGRTIAGVRDWLEARGVEARNVRVAVLAATTPEGRTVADFWVFETNTRMPWSADSGERGECAAEFQRKSPPAYAPRDL
jgi:hypoxanthine phosphoribosyltransferase